MMSITYCNFDFNSVLTLGHMQDKKITVLSLNMCDFWHIPLFLIAICCDCSTMKDVAPAMLIESIYMYVLLGLY